MSIGVRTTKILQDIDDAISPRVMTQEEAFEFLEELSSEIEARIDGLKSDMDMEEED